MSASTAIEDWETVGYDVPLLVNMQRPANISASTSAPAARAVMHELLKAKRIHGDADHQRQDHGRERTTRCVAGRRRDQATASR